MREKYACASVAAIVSVGEEHGPDTSFQTHPRAPPSKDSMNALLVYPQLSDTFWSFKHALKFLGKRAAQPPLGLMTVAALLPSAWKKRW
jgi:hypothetical protein